MNRKVVAFAIAALFILTLVYSWISYARSFRTVSVDIKREGVSITVYNADGKSVEKLSKDGELSLQKGKYSVVASGENINTNPSRFTVGNTDVHLDIDPGYSTKYLDSLLSGEEQTLSALITATYPTTIKSFTVNPGVLYNYGDWYATTLTQKSPSPGELGDVYRTVLHKEKGAWKIVTTPAIVLSTTEYPSIPRNVLDAANQQSGN